MEVCEPAHGSDRSLGKGASPMRAVAFKKSLPIADADALVDIELPRPQPAGRDLLVKVEAV
jgi:NADPH:quinone reductase